MILVLSCSNDKTLKIWNYFPEDQTLKVLMTTEAHDNEINFVTISPNYEFIATASKDKTAKVGRDLLILCVKEVLFNWLLILVFVVCFAFSCGADQT